MRNFILNQCPIAVEHSTFQIIWYSGVEIG